MNIHKQLKITSNNIKYHSNNMKTKVISLRKRKALCSWKKVPHTETKNSAYNVPASLQNCREYNIKELELPQGNSVK